MKPTVQVLNGVLVLLLFSTQAQAWTVFAGAPGGGQYAAYDQINRGNVKLLEKVWEHRSGDYSYGTAEADLTTFEVNPLFVNNRVYYCTPLGRVAALEPDTGKEAWIFDPGHRKAGTPFGVHVCRGVSYWEDESAAMGEVCNKRIITPVVDGRLVSLDADSGERCESFGSGGEIDLSEYDYINNGQIAVTTPPAVVNDLLVVGAAMSSYSDVTSPNGIVRAFDVRSGEEVWHWNPIPVHLRTKLGGVNVWPPISVDADRDLVFLPTGSPTVDPWGVNRTENLPYANALVALRASTGEVVWHYQIIHHDLWDYDLPAQPVLVDARIMGRQVPAVIQFTKTGLMFAFNRETGEPLFEIEERAVPASDVPGEGASPTQPFPIRPAPLTLLKLDKDNAWGLTFWDRNRCGQRIATYRSEGMYTPPSVQGSVTLPNGFGGVNWGNAAYDPDRNWTIVNATQVANVSWLYPRDDVPTMDITERTQFDASGPLEGTPYQYRSSPILSPFGAPCTPPPWGTVTAIDMDSGDFVWQVPFGRVPRFGLRTPARWGSPLIGGPIATAGGLIFNGASLDHHFRALDTESGEVLWESERLRAPANATPMTYMYKGKQYVVVAAGGNGVAATELSDSLVAFALPWAR